MVEQPTKKNPKQGFTFPRNFGGPKMPVKQAEIMHYPMKVERIWKYLKPTRFSNGFFDTNPKPCNVKDGKFLRNCQQHLLHSFIVNWNIHRPTSPHYWVSVWARKHKKRNVSPAWTLLFTWLLVAVMCNNDSREDKAILKKRSKTMMTSLENKGVVGQCVQFVWILFKAYIFMVIIFMMTSWSWSQ